ncbi:ABC-three component system protein [Rhodococcus globerulus]|uniref:ABC-three component system protein n=1 Tax=Rhodococcus globerulus TaxID=33008 RepID=A0ABU4C4Y0_RHOGO|nr:ABC-three component system protein [Rhodococcus globerulus]MDV6271329.1 ABC-three component system protein [Rhodococcus globerulus]
MDTDVSLAMSMETVDDIVFDGSGSGTPRELWQTKHHVGRRGSLGDASPDIWKTIHNWIETSDGAECVLFSTATSPVDSAASLLAPGRTADAVRKAQAKLEEIAKACGNEASKEYYDKFLKLAAKARYELLSRITVIDQAAAADDITAQLMLAVRKAVPQNRRTPLIERLRGWWHGRAMKHLTLVADQHSDTIELEEVEEQLHHIAQTLRDDNLPLDFSDMEMPSVGEVGEDDRVFVAQLKLIMLHHERIRLAVLDHNRAFLQRSQWQREKLLGVTELADYDRRLVEEWRRLFIPAEEPADAEVINELERRRAALGLYMALGDRPLPEIRRELRSGYIPIGSMHILADRLTIGWHPDWVTLLRERVAEARETA